MHSFIKNPDGTYNIGIWLLQRAGIQQFVPMLQVATLRAAIRVTSTLNGGNGNIDSVMERTSPKDVERPANGHNDEGAARRAAVVRRSRAKAAHAA